MYIEKLFALKQMWRSNLNWMPEIASPYCRITNLASVLHSIHSPHGSQ
jgi:hypothetical protein